MTLLYHQNYRATGKPRKHIKASSLSFVIGKSIAIFLPSQSARAINVDKINISLQKQEFRWLDDTTRGHPYTSHVGLQTCQLFE